MADWNPALYTRYEDERTRPARDLLARVGLQSARLAIDLGCGPGNSTELLVDRFPSAAVVGTDNSPSMIESARERLPEAKFPKVRFELGDITSWQSETPPDLIYANASLQWVPAHETLLPRLLQSLAPLPVSLSIPSTSVCICVARAPVRSSMETCTRLPS